MKHKRPKSYVAKLGLAAALMGGACKGPDIVHSPPAISINMTNDEKARADLLRSFYEEMQNNILQYSPEEIPTILESMAGGYESYRRWDLDHRDAQGQRHTWVYIEGAPPASVKLHIGIDSLVRGLENLKQQNIASPTRTEVKDIMQQALYSALLHEKYRDVEMYGYNVQNFLQGKMFGNLIQERISAAVEKIISNNIPEANKLPQAIAPTAMARK